ncbi:Hemolysin secretion protein D, chromosomal [Pseudomonas fluorescens]|uniref:HlyD family type I secretion periplasmic adaptor subunit n=1 Tax=Pseudomonas fluorescens TaxID=294 RepID=UPI0012542BBD|nr:HlyD family type I secretion periplasmic adaptor subunit [Pseudomonas fluorescens]CAG8864074.1 Hemolysin secretion protein D, chromosomal [Pseudomonas fluorescens]VVP94278.1 Hemolysin secretion protein D, chromosomal [Pseudomonas fluorescens]
MKRSYGSLFERYRDTWRHAWQRRKEQEQRREHQELEFLPAAMALQETPVHPAPRYLQGCLLMFASIAVIWAFVGEIDVVASASGKIVPSGKSKVIQSSEVAVVRAIHVSDGQTVKAGDLLVELDGQITAADVQRLGNDLLAAQIDKVRAGAFLTAIDERHEPEALAALIPQATPAQQQVAQRWLQGQYLELRTTLDQVEADIEQRSAEIRSARAKVDSLLQMLVITRQLAADYRQLLSESAVAKHLYLEKEQARLDQEREVVSQRLRVDELLAARKAAEHRHASVTAQARRAMLDLHNEAEQRSNALALELSKAEQRHSLKTLKSPVDGTVQQLAIHTRGGVVTEAQALMVIVPSDQPVEVEVVLENKDIGFVLPGQAVEIKVETFTFTKYGVIPGIVQSISSDAIEDERRGLMYHARVRLEQSHIRVGDRDVPLSAGMAVRAEVITDRRKVISYFLSPLKRYVNESLGER